MTMPNTQKQARMLGAPKYMTGAHCKWGHAGPRWTQTGNCCECTNEHNRRAREAFAVAREAAKQTVKV